MARQSKSIPTISSSFDSFARSSKQGLRRRSTDRLDRVVSGETIKLLLINRSLVRNSLRIEEGTPVPRAVNNFREERKHTMWCENSISSRPLFLRAAAFFMVSLRLFFIPVVIRGRLSAKVIRASSFIILVRKREKGFPCDLGRLFSTSVRWWWQSGAKNFGARGCENSVLNLGRFVRVVCFDCVAREKHNVGERGSNNS